MTPLDGLPAPTPRVLIESNRALPLIAVTVALRAGAITDPVDLSGRARFTARLMRRTAGGRDPLELDNRIDRLGGALSVDASHSCVVFQGVVLSRSFPRFIELLTDVLARPGFAGDELERLRRESESELLEALDDDRTVAQRWFRRRLFPEDAYGRPVSGTPRSLARLTGETVTGFHRAQVSTDNIVVALAGDVDEDRAQRAVAELVAALPRGDRFTDTSPDPRPRQGRHLVLVDKPDRTQTQIFVGCLGTRADDPDHTALLVANSVFGGTFGARLAREIRVERGWSYGAYSSLAVDRRRHAFSVWTFPAAADAPACLHHQIDMLERWREDGITQDELERAQNYLIRSHVFAIDTPTKRVGLALDEELHGLFPGYYDQFRERVRDVTREAANAAIRRRIDLDGLLVVVLGTDAVVGGPIREAIPRLESAETVSFDADL